MIKRINLRGISRTPSDRMTEDGGCAESLNVHLDTQELAPTLMPVPVPDLPALHEYLYIHKAANYTNYIYNEGNTLCFTPATGDDELVDLNARESVNAVSSIGNTLIVATNQRTMYFVFQNGEYSQTSANLTEGPDVIFYPTSVTERNLAFKGYETPHEEEPQQQPHGITDIDFNPIDYVNALASAKTNKHLGHPVFMVAAYRMHNGDYVQSLPQIVGYQSLLPANLAGEWEEKTAVDHYGVETFWWEYTCGFKHLEYLPAAKLLSSGVDNLKTTVQGIDIFMSLDVNPFGEEIGLIYGKILQETALHDGKSAVTVNGIDVEQELLKYSNFFKVASFNLGDATAMQSLMAGTEIKLGELYQNTERAAKESLPTDVNTHDELLFDDIMVLNNRLIASLDKSSVSRGVPYTQTLMRGTFQDDFRYRLTYYIHNESGEDLVAYAHDVNGGDMLTPFMPTQYRPGGFLLHPSVSCYKAVIMEYDADGNQTGSTTIEMQEHPNLNCSYGLVPPDLRPFNLPLGADNPEITERPAERREYAAANKMFMTELDNPFYFGAEGEQTFSSEIIGFATTTKALSTGQFGQFPLYVFTADGIYAMPLNADGTIAGSKPLSRDVAIKGTISPIDDAVVFVSDKGVMLLQGSGIANISPFMNGESYSLADDLSAPFVEGEDWHGIAYGVVADVDFLTFVKGSRITFDYAGNRLLCFNAAYPYQYVYMIGTQTWHKLAIIPKSLFVHALNSYPDTLICVNELPREGSLGGMKVLNFSPFIGDVPDEAIHGVIATRAFDLGEPDIRKVIKSVRIRGYFNRDDVKYVLFGSMDGIHFGALRSLYGGSFKFFRIVLLTSLKPNERITYLEIDYDTRFANRLR